MKSISSSIHQTLLIKSNSVSSGDHVLLILYHLFMISVIDELSMEKDIIREYAK